MANTKITLLVVFVAAMLARLTYNLNGPNVLFCGDGFEYITDSQAMYALATKNLPALWAAFYTQDSVALSGLLQPLHDLVIAGPVFPLFITASYMLLGQSPAINQPITLLIMQSIVSSLTCVLIASICSVCWNRRVALLGGLTAALYPAFIVNTGLLDIGMFATFLLATLLLFTCLLIMKDRHSTFCAAAAGITAAALQLTRSVMLVFSVIVLFFIVASVFLNEGKSIRSVIKPAVSYLLGFFLVMLPWLYFSHIAFGTANMILDRAGYYNFFVGNSVDSLGWLPVPCPNLFGIDRAGALNILYCAAHKHPERWLQLLQDKLLRLFTFPYNVFRIPIGPVNFQIQALSHKVLLLFSVLGIGGTLFTSIRSTTTEQEVTLRNKLMCKILLLATLLFHLIYVFFITVARYNLTMMPEVITFAAAGAVWWLTLLNDIQKRTQAVCLIAAAITFFLVTHSSLQFFSEFSELDLHPLLAMVLLSVVKASACIIFFYTLWRASVSGLAQGSALKRRSTTIIISILGVIVTSVLALPARANGRLFEWQSVLRTPADTFTAVIRLPKTLQSRACYLLLDSDGLQQIQHDTVVRVNGRQLSGTFIPQLSLMGNLVNFTAIDLHHIYLECGYIFNCLSGPSNISNVDLRQWFFIPLPEEILESGLKLGYLQVEIAPSGTNPVYVFGQQVIGNRVLMPSTDRCSWEKTYYSVESDGSRFSDPRYDFELKTTAPNGSLMPDVLLLTTSKNHSTISAAGIPATVVPEGAAGSLIRSGSVIPYGKDDFWVIKVCGHLKPAKAALSLAEDIRTILNMHASVISTVFSSQQPLPLHMSSTEWDRQGLAYGPIKSPQSFIYNPPWMPHKVVLGTQDTSFDVAFPLIPSAMPGKVQSVELSISSNNTAPKLSNCKIEIYNLPCCPIEQPFMIKAPECIPMVSSLMRHERKH